MYAIRSYYARIDTVTDLVQTLESGVNDIVFVGIAIGFLLNNFV